MIIGKHGTLKRKMGWVVDVSVIQISLMWKASKAVVLQNGLMLLGDGHPLDISRRALAFFIEARDLLLGIT